MKSDLSPRDWQDISSYLDRRLTVETQARLEERLHNELHLRDAFADLQRTRALLRSQPRLRAPRNFTLTPEMVGKRSSAPGYPILGLVSALASLLFIVLLVGDLLNQRATLAPVQIASEMQAETAQFEAASSLTTEAAEEAAATHALELEAAPLAAFAVTEAPLDAQPPAAVAKIAVPQPTPSEISGSPPAESAIQPPSEQARQFNAPQSPVEDTGELSSDRTAPAATSAQIFGVNQNFWHGLEILAAILAVATGMAWWIRRQRL
jgi:cytoskeletal protein RodZ